MKTSITATKLVAGERRTKPTVVALAIRGKALAAAVAERLAGERDCVVSLCPHTTPALLAQWLDEIHADVLLLDERSLHRLGAGTVPSLRARWPDQLVLLVGERASAAFAEQVVRHRLQGFLLAKNAADTCVRAVRAVRRGETWMPRALLVELLLEHVHAADQGSRDTGGKLTLREAEVVGYVRRGFANKEIAESLAIREDTVKKHLRNAYTKLGVHRRSELMTGAV